MSEECIARKCGIRFTPPAIIIIYDDTVAQKTRKYIMPVRNFRSTSNINFVANDIMLRHKKVLNNVPLLTIERMLRLLQENMKGTELDTALQLINKEYSISEDEDLNKLSTEELQRKKEIMDQTFVKFKVTPDDPNYVYDKRVDFGGDESKGSIEWDEELQEEATAEVKDKPNEDAEKEPAEELDDFWNI